MNIPVVLSSDEILRGLKHYRRIAKQDILRAEEHETEHLRHYAEARRNVYSTLSDIASEGTPQEVLAAALESYKQLPFVTGTPEDEYIDIKGQEDALKNFFLMIGLEKKVKREIRSQRPPLKSLQTLH